MLTAPYGHDGRFATVSAVIEHYRSGITDGPTLDPVLKNRISISNNERADLIQFLHTLTDTTFTKDKRFSDPG
jgi:cytochrome c peroxidase